MTKQQRIPPISDVTFSDSLLLSEDVTTTSDLDMTFHSTEEYCKKYPDYLGCLEYDT